MSDNVAARRYAVTLFRLAREAAIVDNVERDFVEIEKIMNTNPKWALILDDLRAPLSIKEKMVDEIGSKLKFQEYTRSFVKLLAKNRQVHLFDKIDKVYRKRLLESKKIVEVAVTVSSQDIWKELENEIRKSILEYSGQKADIDLKIDPSIIGGIVLKVEDTVIDGSISGELNRLKKKLLDQARAIV